MSRERGEAPRPAAAYYPVIGGVSLLAALVLSRTSDLLTLMIEGAVAVGASLAVGFVFQRWSPVPLSKPGNATVAAIIAGGVVSSLGLLFARLLLR